jgi:fibronectin type 3 domain-containing protein
MSLKFFRNYAIAVLLLSAVLPVEQLYAAIGFVQGGYATPQSPQSVVSVTYTGAQGAGNLNVVVVGWNDTTAAVSSVTDSKGNLYTLAVGPTQLSGQLSQAIYYAKGVLSAAAGGNTVTVRFTTPAVYADIRILEYSGLDQLNPVDVTAAATGTNASSTSGSATTTNANDLIFGANIVATLTQSAGTGFTRRMITSPDGDIAEDRVVTAIGTYSATAPLSSAGPWIMQMVAFKAASGGGTSDTTPPTAPSNLLATANGSGSINLTWTASTDNVGVTNYFIERCQGSGCTSFAQVATSTATAYSDTGLLAGTSYSYRVRATDAAGNLSSYSNVSTATTSQSTASPIAFIQVAYATPQTSQSTVSVTFASAQTAGNLNVVVVGWNDMTAAVSSITDSMGNVYALAVGPTQNPGSTGTFSLTQSIYYAKNIAGASANGNTVTVRFTVPANYADVRILEYSGLDRINPVDVTAAAIGTSSTSNSGSAVTTNPNDLIFGANMVYTGTAGAGAGFTNRTITTPDSDIAEDRIVSTTGTYSAGAPLTSSGPWIMQMVAFRGGAAGPPPPPPDQVGQWSGPFDWPIVAVHMALLPTGRLLASDGQDLGQNAIVWDPSTNLFSQVNTGDNIFCNGAAGLADGRILVAGGHITAHVGLNVANLFNPFTQTWTAAPQMAYPRWYPTVTVLPDGRAMVTGGETNCDGCEAVIPEVYDPNVNLWTQLTNAPLNVPYYPHIFVLPDGRVLNSSTGEAPVPARVLNLQTQTWTIVDPTVLDGGSAVMYRPGKVLKTGTSVNPDQATRPSVSTAYVLDMTQGSPAWVQVPSMNFARTYHNSVMLPDGNVLITGGGQTTDALGLSTAVFQAEMWSPATQTFTTLSSMVTPRLYHSGALLLPDGRVLVAGGGRFNPGTAPTDQLSSEIYSPPYLFKGARPAISAAPSVIPYATNFTITTPDATQISSVALIRLGAVTHAFDHNQRYIPLTFQQASGGLTAQAPSSANLAPPGYYMLFIVNATGVPSIASIVQVR